MRHCKNCGFLGMSGYEYLESYCTIGIQDDDLKSVFQDGKFIEVKKS